MDGAGGRRLTNLISRLEGNETMAVTGATPVTFISESTQPGKQYQIPLSAITITNGVADASGWITDVGLSGSDATADTGVVARLLAGLVAQGLIAVPPA
jgi:hypothetical protein